MTLIGLHGLLVEVEADLGPGLPAFGMVGLPDTAVNESRDRVRAAILNSGESWPAQRITVGLSPAEVRKRGSGFDLALAVAVLAGAGSLPLPAVADLVFFGELGLDGRVRPVRGVLPAVLAAVRGGIRRVAVPAGNADEAGLVPDVEVVAVDSLRQLLAVLRGLPTEEDDPQPPRPGRPAAGRSVPADPERPGRLDLADVLGQAEACRGLEIAAAPLAEAA